MITLSLNDLSVQELMSICPDAVKWCNEHPDLSVQELMSICPRGEWILWVYTEAGYAPEVLAPVAYRAAERALGHTTDALDRAGVPHGLHGLVITDAESARAAAGVAAGVAEWAAEVTEAACVIGEKLLDFIFSDTLCCVIVIFICS